MSEDSMPTSLGNISVPPQSPQTYKHGDTTDQAGEVIIVEAGKKPLRTRVDLLDSDQLASVNAAREFRGLSPVEHGNDFESGEIGYVRNPALLALLEAKAGSISVPTGNGNTSIADPLTPRVEKEK